MNSHRRSLLWWFGASGARAQARTLSLCGWWVALLLQVPAWAAGNADLAPRIEAAARKLLLEQAAAKGLVDPVAELKLVANAAPVPACAEPLQIDALDTRTPARMRFAAVCNGADGWQREWIVRAELSARIVVAAADVPVGQVLAATDVALERRRVTDMGDVLSDPAAVAGQASSRALRTGQPVQPRWLAAPVLVRRGESVTILARSGGIEVQAAGEALEPGKLRDVVRVRNATTGKIIRARVIDASVVEPEIIGGASSQ
jgi:flagella basal body P-ring formation protein FlgA